MTPDTGHRRPAAPAPTGAGRWLDLRFRGLAQGVLIPDRAELRQGLEDIVAGWPVDIRPAATPEPRQGDILAALLPNAADPARYDFASLYADAPLCGLPAASALCAILADVLMARTEANPGALTLHCGAVRMGAGLVALTGPHRAGKSTLTARLTAEPDLAVFCDDVLPLDADGRGIALGIAPRLRLPLPPGASDRFHRHVSTHLGPADDRYGYLCAPTVARHGTRAPLAALVVLDRRESGPARLHRLDPDSAMQHLLARNMGDLGDAGHAFGLARAAARRAQCLTLVYSDLEEAVALLRRAFTGARDADIAPPLPPATPETAEVAGIDPDTPWHRTGDAVIRRVGGSSFLWRPGDTTLWQMNRMAEAVWAALEIPGSARDVAEILADLFPGTPEARILADVSALLATLADRDLVGAVVSSPT